MRQVPGVTDVINTGAASFGETRSWSTAAALSDLGLTSPQVGQQPAHGAERHASRQVHTSRPDRIPGHRAHGHRCVAE